MIEPTLYDKNTVSGTFVNGQRLDMGENPDGLLLVNGDTITLGTSETKFKFICKKDELARLAHL